MPFAEGGGEDQNSFQDSLGQPLRRSRREFNGYLWVAK
jgi:hypothetical protein